MGHLLALNYHRSFVIEECWVCHITFAMTLDTKDDFVRDGTTFFCPKGCRLSYGEGTIARLERELADSQRRLNAEAMRATTNYQLREKAEKSLKRLKKRAVAGVCPVQGCQRTCSNMARHVATKHPEYRAVVTAE